MKAVYSQAEAGPSQPKRILRSMSKQNLSLTSLSNLISEASTSRCVGIVQAGIGLLRYTLA